MTIPLIFSTDFRYRELLGVTDMQTVLDAVIDEITLQLPAASRWTSLGGGEYQSPAEQPTGANRYMRVLMTRVSATRFGFHTKERDGSTVLNGTFDFVTTCTARIFSGPRHLCIEVEYGAGTYESGWASLIDPSPFSLGSLPHYVAAMTRRNSVGTTHGANESNEAFINDGAGASVADRIFGMYLNAGKTTSGADIALPCEILTRVSGVDYDAGKLYQMLQVSELLAAGVERDVPLDSGVTGRFRVLGKVSDASFKGKMAFRKA